MKWPKHWERSWKTWIQVSGLPLMEDPVQVLFTLVSPFVHFRLMVGAVVAALSRVEWGSIFTLGNFQVWSPRMQLPRGMWEKTVQTASAFLSRVFLKVF